LGDQKPSRADHTRSRPQQFPQDRSSDNKCDNECPARFSRDSKQYLVNLKGKRALEAQSAVGGFEGVSFVDNAPKPGASRGSFVR
jgi:hypothetical protein